MVLSLIVIVISFLGITIISNGTAETLNLCQYQSKYIGCKAGQKIKMDIIEQGLLKDTSCDIFEHQNCSSDFTHIRKKCDGKTSCTLIGMDFSTSICKVYPRYIGVSYKCLEQIQYWWDSYYWINGGICSSIEWMRCHSSFLISKIQFSYTSTVILRYCDKEWNAIEKCLENEFTQMCYGKQNCNHTKAKDPWCFVLPFWISITYTCFEDSVSDGIDNTTKSATEYPLWRNVPSIDRVSSNWSLTDQVREVTNDSDHINLYIDNEFRLLGFNTRNNITYCFCAYLWDNTKASVVCRHLNLSYTGVGSEVSTRKIYTRIEFGIICKGNESSLFDCNPDTSDEIAVACQSSGDATVRCSVLANGISNISFSGLTGANGELPESSSKTAVVIGVTAGCLTIVVMVVGVFLWIRRSKRSIKIMSKRPVPNHHVVYENALNNERATILSEKTKNSEMSSLKAVNVHSSKPLGDNTYLVLDPSETGYNRTLESKNHNINDDKNLINNDEVPEKSYVQIDSDELYAASRDGVYDVTNSRRHIENDDVNVYSHSVDDVYDVSGHGGKSHEEEDNTYNHFFGKDHENDYM